MADMGLAAGAGGGMAYKLLQDMLQRRFLEEQEAARQKNAEVNQAQGWQQLGDTRAYHQASEARLRDTDAREGRQFDTTEARQNSEFKALEPVRIGQARNANSNAATNDWQRSPEKRAADQKDALELENARGNHQVQAAQVRQSASQTLGAGQQIAQTRLLRSEYQKATKPAREMHSQLQMMDAGLEEARKGNLNAGSQAVLVTFQKILDPASVVRESEYARSQAGLGILQQMEGIIPRLKHGGPGVPVAELEKFAELARTMTAIAKLTTDANAKQIGDIAEKYGLDRKLVEQQDDDPADKPKGKVFDWRDGKAVPR